jgi:hypothetical protein
MDSTSSIFFPFMAAKARARSSSRVTVSSSLSLSPNTFAKLHPHDPSSLPWGVFEHVLQFLDVDELARTSLINKRWKRTADQPCLWNSLAQRLGYDEEARDGEPEKKFAKRKFLEARVARKQRELRVRIRKEKEFKLSALKTLAIVNAVLGVVALPFVWKTHPDICKILLGVIFGLVIAKENVLERIWGWRYGKPVLIGSGTLLLLVVAKEVGWVKDSSQTKEIQNEAMVLLYLIHGYRYVGVLFLIAAAWMRTVYTNAVDMRGILFSVGLGGGFLTVSEFVLRINGTPVLDHEPFFWQLTEFLGFVGCFYFSIRCLRMRVAHDVMLKMIRSLMSCSFLAVSSKLILFLLNMESPNWLWIQCFMFLIRGLLPHALPVVSLTGMFEQVRELNPSENVKRLLMSMYITTAIVLEASLIVLGRVINDHFRIQLMIITMLSNPVLLMFYTRRICIYLYCYSFNNRNRFGLHIPVVLSWISLELIFSTKASDIIASANDILVFVPLFMMFRWTTSKMIRKLGIRRNRRLVVWTILDISPSIAFCALMRPSLISRDIGLKTLEKTIDSFENSFFGVVEITLPLVAIGAAHFILRYVQRRYRNNQRMIDRVGKYSMLVVSCAGISFVFMAGFILRILIEKYSPEKISTCPLSELIPWNTAAASMCPDYAKYNIA